MAALIPRFRAVVFDWRGTLVVAPDEQWLAKTALLSLGRPSDPAAVDAVVDRLRCADVGVADSARVDASAELHRAAYLLWFRDAGLDAALSEALYRAESDVLANPFAVDAPAVLGTLAEAGVRLGVLSDIHVDIRPAFAACPCPRGGNLAELIDAWVLSYEVGKVKPEPDVFELMLARLDLPAGDVLMVGDRGGWDGAAAHVGMTALILPALQRPTDRRLARVLDLVLPGEPIEPALSAG